MTMILVIEEDEQIVLLLKRILDNSECTVRHAPSGIKGMREYRESPAKLVICDIFMDRQDGLVTIRQLLTEFSAGEDHCHERRGAVVGGDYFFHAVRFGAATVLRKPFGQEEVLKVVRQILYH